MLKISYYRSSKKLSRLWFIIVLLTLMTGCSTHYLRSNVSVPNFNQAGDYYLSGNIGRFGNNYNLGLSPIKHLGLMYYNQKLKKINNWSSYESRNYNNNSQNEQEVAIGYYQKIESMNLGIYYGYAEGNCKTLWVNKSDDYVNIDYQTDYKKQSLLVYLNYQNTDFKIFNIKNLRAQSSFYFKEGMINFQNQKVFTYQEQTNPNFLYKTQACMEFGFYTRIGFEKFKVITCYSMGVCSIKSPINNYYLGLEFSGNLYSDFQK